MTPTDYLELTIVGSAIGCALWTTFDRLLDLVLAGVGILYRRYLRRRV